MKAGQGQRRGVGIFCFKNILCGPWEEDPRPPPHGAPKGAGFHSGRANLRAAAAAVGE